MEGRLLKALQALELPKLGDALPSEPIEAATGAGKTRWSVKRFPLIAPPDADGRYVLVEVEPGSVFTLSNLHLPSNPYGPDLVRDGATLEAVLANERDVRMPALLPYLQTLPGLLERGLAVIVTGDFNSPAHTDWTEDMVGQRRFLNFAVDWPVNIAGKPLTSAPAFIPVTFESAVLLAGLGTIFVLGDVDQCNLICDSSFFGCGLVDLDRPATGVAVV